MTAPNNALIFNGGVCGYLAGLVRGRFLTKVLSSDASYEALAAEGANWAVAIDADIARDVPTSSPDGIVPPGTVAISFPGSSPPAGSALYNVASSGSSTQATFQLGELGKCRLVDMLSLAAFETRYYAQPTLQALTSAELAALATRISESYLQQGSISGEPIGLTSVTTTAAPNNSITASGVFLGTIGGILVLNQGGVQLDQTTLLTIVGGALAGAFDALIPTDATISVSGGQPQNPFYTGTTPLNQPLVQGAQLGKHRLALSIALATMEQRSTFSLKQFGSGSAFNEAAIAAWSEAVAPPLAAAYEACAPGIVTSSATPGHINNPALYNEAYCGFIAGILAGRPITSTSSSDPSYEALSSAATAFATEVDSLIGLDTTITNSNALVSGQNIVQPPATGEGEPAPNMTIEQELGKSGVLWAICRGVNHGRSLLNNALDAESSTYEASAEAVVALYTAMITVLVAP